MGNKKIYFKKIHLVGIKGVGMTGLATLYKEWGYEVLGSDTDEEFFTDRILRELGIKVLPFDERNIGPHIDEVIYSTAYTQDHPELKKARDLGLTTKTYTAALAEIFNSKRGIIVTGSHGKTTSAAMLGRVLEEAGWDPTVLVGGEVLEWGRTARAGKSEWMVAEGDEYQAKILILRPQILLLTNIEYDHPDFYPTHEAYENVFRKLVASMPADGILVAHESLREFISTIYRTNSTITRVEYFSMNLEAKLPSLMVWGEHNRTNAAGVLTVARTLGIADNISFKTLSGFRGTRRRMELYTPEDDSIVVMDDYAHHPTEIRATLEALRVRYPKRKIVAIFQPHTFSRTKAMLEDFAKAFRDADYVIFLEIYGSARETEKTIRGEDLFLETKKNHTNVFFAKTIEEAIEVAQKIKAKESVFTTLGAGDVWRVAHELAKQALSNEARRG
ncbi:MAG: UDP-N-acetylmuramate--L-alanine ligase [Candidatus Ryanbacteria bacterium]|nr:UDP-N-acetylmuramate--L-alanine ligase [Candidatus Ryanbacteria bacterium]